MGIRIATWNVNSIRSRLDRVLAWLEQSDVDVLAMQETKCGDDQFPSLPFAAYGYEVVHHGRSHWNGVAIASRMGLTDIATSFPGQPAWGEPPVVEPRSISAVVGGLRICNVYVPNGREVAHPHYAYKLKWLAALRSAAEPWRAGSTVLVGDWNVAPHDDDVWSMKWFTGRTHVSQPERAAFARFLEDGYSDVVRPFEPGPGVFTFWDYTSLRFERNQGMRLDFVLASPSVAAQVTNARIDRDERAGTSPSDHAPVIVDLDRSLR